MAASMRPDEDFRGGSLWESCNFTMEISTADVLSSWKSESGEFQFPVGESKVQVSKSSEQFPAAGDFLSKWHIQVEFSYDRNSNIFCEEIIIFLDGSFTESVFAHFTILVKIGEKVLHRKEAERSFNESKKYVRYALSPPKRIENNSSLKIDCSLRVKIDDGHRAAVTAIREAIFTRLTCDVNPMVDLSEFLPPGLTFLLRKQKFLAEQMAKEKRRNDKLFNDVLIKVRGTDISAHRCILFDRSPVFVNMYADAMKKTGEKCVKITDVTLDTMNYLLVFLYTSEIPVLKRDTIMELLKAAEKYGILDLKIKCELFLMSILTEVNALHLLVLADKCGALLLKHKALAEICTNPAIFKDRKKMSVLDDKPHLLIEIMQNVPTASKK